MTGARMRTVLLLTVATAVAASPAPEALSRYDAAILRGARAEQGVVLLRVDAELGPDAVAHRAGEVSCRVVRRFGNHAVYKLSCDDTRAALVALGRAEGVIGAEGSFEVRLAAPDDLDLTQWWHHNEGQEIRGQEGVGDADIDSPEAWDVVVGGSGVVAVIDTGALLAHEDLVGRVFGNELEDCENGLDDDGNGYADDCWGYDIGDDDNDVDPSALPSKAPSGYACIPGHGTFIGSLVGAEGDNGLGIVGVGWELDVLPIKLPRDEDCGVFESGIAEAILYAADRGADVINASWHHSTYSETIAEAFAYAGQRGTLSVIAAGNEGRDADASVSYPIDYPFPERVVVGATDNRDELVTWSNYGASQVDIAAPGEDLYAASHRGVDQYGWGSGTSYSAPLVAGAAALVRSVYPDLSPMELKIALESGGDVLSSLDCEESARCVRTGARLNVRGALDVAATLSAGRSLRLDGVAILDAEGDDTFGDGDGVLEIGERADISIALTNDGEADLAGLTVELVGYSPFVRDLLGPVALGDLPVGASWMSDAFRVSVSQACSYDHAAAIGVHVVDEDGRVYADWLPTAIACVLDEDDDGVMYPADCDDLNPEVFPGAPEVCNGIDDNCNGQRDEEFETVAWWLDADGDGYGAPASEIQSCYQPEGFVDNSGDCDDGDEGVYPEAVEQCNAVDDDCDTLVDEEASDAVRWHLDSDGDGFGGPDSLVECTAPDGYVDNDRDCDDGDPDAYPGTGRWTEECEHTGCGCSGGPGSVAGIWGLLLLALARRRTIG